VLRQAGPFQECIVSGIFLELVRGGIYKRTQGKITRQVTAAALFITIVLGCWQLSMQWKNKGTEYEFGIPGILVLLGGWISYRLVNYPPFADFLIAVEAEMAKVNWPSRRELFRASVVVLVSMLVLAVVLVVYDILCKFLLFNVLNISNQ
jgi:preprotein translocase subunit SecE